LNEWLPSRPTPPTRISRRLEILHTDNHRAAREKNRLHVPHGIAFGSGEHATTFMLLKALAVKGDWSHARVLDLGTGSGVLALAARQFGARKIVATDFDPDSIRTARQNEALNFSTPLIQWRQADVKKLRPSPRYDLVLANLFSGILVEAAAQIRRCVSPGGDLWLSGILGSQEKEVITAYRRQGLKHSCTNRRGKWVMLELTQPA
jgi:ribosomal protein L11 methyltransferase